MAAGKKLTLRVKAPGPIPHVAQSGNKRAVFEPDATFTEEDETYSFGMGLLQTYPNKFEEAKGEPNLKEYKGTDGQPYDGKKTSTAQKADDSEGMKRLKLELESARQLATDEKQKVADLTAELETANKDLKKSEEALKNAQTEIKSLSTDLKQANKDLKAANDELEAAQAEIKKLKEAGPTGDPAKPEAKKS